MYLLDTNICIALLKNNRAAVLKFEQHFEQSSLTSIVVAELYKGVYCSQRIEQNLMVLEQFTSLLPVLDFDSQSAREFGKIQGELRRIGKPTGEIDAIIAAVARSRDLTLVTNNLKHFQNIADLKLAAVGWAINCPPYCYSLM